MPLSSPPRPRGSTATDLATSVLFVANEVVEQLVTERRTLTDNEDDNDDDHNKSQVLFSLVFRRLNTGQTTLLQSASCTHQLLQCTT